MQSNLGIIGTIKNKSIQYRGLLFYSFFLFALMLKCFYFQFSSGASIRPYVHIANIRMLTATFGILLVITSFILLLKRAQYPVIITLNLLLSILLLSDTVYFRYFSNAITVPVIFQVALLDSLGESILNLLKVGDAVFFIDIPFMIAGAILLKKSAVRETSIKIRIVLCILALIMGIAAQKLVLSQINTEMSKFDKNYITRQQGILKFHVEDVKTFVKENVLKSESLTEDEKAKLNNFFAEKKKTAETEAKEFNSIAKGKNVIIIQSEAMQSFLINNTINGKEITPNINKLLKDSVYFDNIYYQSWTGKTADSEFIANNSLYAASTGTAYFRFPINSYHSLAKRLDKEGYNSYVFHAYEPSFYNRTVVYRTFGFDNFFSKKNFITDEKVGWGLSDKSFFRQSLDKLKGKDPFYGFMVTLSSHYPFDMFKDYEFDVGKYEGTFFGNYIKGENYADSCIGLLIEELKARGMYDNTLLVIYGDHYGVPKQEAGAQLLEFMGAADNPFEWMKLQKVPLIIHYPGLRSGETINTTGGQVDILPTIANLMGLDSSYMIGKDLFNSKSGYAVLRDSSVITDSYLFLSQTSAAYDIKTGNPLNTDSYKKELEKYQSELEISDIILQKNVFKNKEFSLR